MVFDVTIKTHWQQHAGRMAKFLNPVMGWNYINEDFMKHSRDLMQECVHGSDAPQSQVKFMERYRHALRWQLEQLDRESD